VGKITFQRQITNGTIKTIDSKLVVRSNANFTSKTGLAAFLFATERRDSKRDKCSKIPVQEKVKSASVPLDRWHMHDCLKEEHPRGRRTPLLI